MPPKTAKRGLSNEEKRVKLIEFFTREHSFYNIKEVETLGSKYVGVHPMQMKQLLQELIDDDLVRSEKCGVTSVYWCFEYDKVKRMKGLVADTEAKLLKLKSKKEALKKDIENERNERRKGSYLKLKDDREQLERRKVELQKFIEASSFNVDNIATMQVSLNQMINAGECFTDNIETLLSYFLRENGIERIYFQQELNIPEEFKDFPSIQEVFNKLMM